MSNTNQRGSLTRLLVIASVIVLAPLRLLSRLLGFGSGHGDEEDEQGQISEEALERRHEVADIPVRPILWFMGFLAVAALVIHVALWGMFELLRVSTATQPRSPLYGTAVVPPAPRLQANPGADMAEFSQREAQSLFSYGWVDQQQGVVHIPIDRAMELLAQRGLPTSEDAGAGEPGMGYYDAHDLDSEGGQELRAIFPTARPLGAVTPSPEATETPQQATETPETGTTPTPEAPTTPTPSP